MNVREKLAKLLVDISYDKELGWYDLRDMRDGAEDIADLLIKNGVTVQEWISLEDRLPEKSEKYIVHSKTGAVYQTKFYSYPKGTGGHWGQKDEGRNITHWMPLPEPPKIIL